MPRVNWNEKIKERLDQYLKEYEVDFNNSNDLSSLRQMVSLELSIERNQKALLKIDPVQNPNQVKALQTAIKDATNAYVALQTELGINRRKRKDEGDSQTSNARLYVEWLKENAPKFLDSRMKKVYCSHCGQYLGKYWFVVDASGAEQGSMEAETKPPKPMKYTVRFQCWRCFDKHPSIEAFGEESNER